MRVPSRLLAVALFLAVGLIALCVAGLLDWIVGVLFLTMEFLGEALRSVFRRRERRHPPTRSHHAKIDVPRKFDRQRGSIGRRGRPRRKQSSGRENQPELDLAGQRTRILVAVSGDESDLLDYAVEECRSRQAELILLFLRPIAITPMGPNPLPGLSEDDEARSVFDRIRSETDRASVPLRTIYTTTNDRPATIGKVATSSEADLVIVGSIKRRGLSGFLSRDLNQVLLRSLPERASLTYFNPRQAHECAS